MTGSLDGMGGWKGWNEMEWIGTEMGLIRLGLIGLSIWAKHLNGCIGMISVGVKGGEREKRKREGDHFIFHTMYTEELTRLVGQSTS